MNVINGKYISSSGKETPLEDLPYPYLVNAYNKAVKEFDNETADALRQEIEKRPPQE